MPGIENTPAAGGVGRAGALRDAAPARAATFSGRTVTQATVPPERFGGSVRSTRSATSEPKVGGNDRRAGPDPDAIYEAIDTVPDGAAPVRSGSGAGPASTLRRTSDYNALRPPPLPAMPAGGLRRRRVRQDGVPAGRLATAPGRVGGRAAGAVAAQSRSATAVSPERAAQGPAEASGVRTQPYEAALPSSADSLDRLGRYLVNQVEDGRIPREMKGDFEAALLFANQLEGDRARFAEVAAGPDSAERLASEGTALETAHVGEMSRIFDRLEGCLQHEAGTAEARALARGLQKRIGQAYTSLAERVAAENREPRPALRRTRSAHEAALESFVAAAARSRRANAHVTLTGRPQPTVSTGRLARWRSERRVEANRATAERFVSALRARYGDEIARVVASSEGVQNALGSGRALQAQHINAAVFQANRLSTEYRAANARLASGYGKPNADDVSLTQVKIADVARRIVANHGPSGVASLVDPAAVAEKTAEAIRARGDRGNHLVTTEEATAILDNVVRTELMGTYNAERTAAMAKLAPDDPDSMSARALTDAAAASGVRLDPGRLEPGAVGTLTRRIDEAVRTLDATSLGDDAALRGIAEQVANDWVAARVQSLAALDGAGLDEQAHAAIAEVVLHDATPPALVPHLAAAHEALQGDVGQLGAHLDGAAMQGVLSRIHEGVVRAVADSGIEIDLDNQNEVFAQCWRGLLASGGRAQCESIADQFEPGRGLREYTQGLGWIKRRFPLTAEGSRATAYNDQGEIEIAGKSMSNLSEHLTLMENLSSVLSQAVGRPGEIDDPESLEDLSADAVDVLRGLDFPLPQSLADAGAAR